MKAIAAGLISLVLAISGQTNDAFAFAFASDTFVYQRGQLSEIALGEPLAAWNAKGAEVHKPGLKILFFGDAAGCDPNLRNGPVVKDLQSEDSSMKRGEFEGSKSRWRPSGDSAACALNTRKQKGRSFIDLDESPRGRGIVLHTAAGPDASGRRSFFGPIGEEGRGEEGANANITGSFVIFNLDWKHGEAIRPWRGKQNVAAINTVQAVKAANVGDGIKGSQPIQAKQQLIVGFINDFCFRQESGAGPKCKFKYLFNIAVYRNGVKDWNTVPWFKEAAVWMDPAQGGIPTVRGPLGGSAPSKERRSGLDLYSSLGSPSQHETFGDKEFAIRISLEELQNTLKAIVAKQTGKPIQRLSSMDMEAMFGSKWDNPEEWVLMLVSIGQEVSNPYEMVNSEIEGSISTVRIGPADIQ